MPALHVLTPNLSPSSAWRRSSFFVELNSQSIPEWVQLIPTGEFATRDGRGPFKNSNPAQIIEYFEASWKMPLRFDYDHQSATAGDKAGPVPASGWGLEFEDRGRDGIWCRVEWTTRAKELISAGEYKYLSPEFYHDPKTMEVMAITGASLTNDPALFLKAIATLQRCSMKTPKEMYMAMLKDPTCAAKMREECGMGADSTDEEMMAMMFPVEDPEMEDPEMEDPEEEMMMPEKPEEEKPNSFSRKPAPSLDKFVPREQFNHVLAQVKTLATRIENQDKATAKKEATNAVDAAIQATKIAPANRDYFIAQAIKDLGEFQKFAASTPAILPPKPIVPFGKPPKGKQISETTQRLLDATPKELRRDYQGAK